MPLIREIHAREVLDSRGDPTLEVDVVTETGYVGRAAVGSAGSAGEHAAKELRDGTSTRFRGRGVAQAAANVDEVIAPALRGFDSTDQATLDGAMLDLDGTEDKSKLGVNALLAVSMAAARAGAVYSNLPLWRHLGGICARTLPVPMLSMLAGGARGGQVDIRELMIVPLGGGSFREALRVGVETFHGLREILSARGHATEVGEAGAFSPPLTSNEEALSLVLEAIEKVGYAPGDDVAIALDLKAGRLRREGDYRLGGEAGRELSSEALVGLYGEWTRQYPIVSIEDGMAESDRRGWKLLTDSLAGLLQVVGGELFATQAHRLAGGIQDGIANAVRVQPSEAGTVSETLATMDLAAGAGYARIVSHQRGETEDTFLADLAVATNAGQVRTGAVCRWDRTAKLNQLIRIEEELGATAVFPGPAAFRRGSRVR